MNKALRAELKLLADRIAVLEDRKATKSSVLDVARDIRRDLRKRIDDSLKDYRSQVPLLPGAAKCATCSKLDFTANMTKFTFRDSLDLMCPDHILTSVSDTLVFYHPACLEAAGYEKTDAVNGWQKKPTPKPRKKRTAKKVDTPTKTK